MKSIVVVIFIYIATCSVSLADTHQDVISGLSEMGVSYTQSGPNVDVIIDQNKALDAVPTLQETGSLNPNVSQATVNQMPVTYSAFAVGMIANSAILELIYENSDIDKLHVQNYLLTVDASGASTKILCYSYDFNRAVYNSIDWNNINTGGFIKILPNYVVTDWCLNKTNAEGQLNK